MKYLYFNSRVSQATHAWIMDNGGHRMIRKLILACMSKRVDDQQVVAPNEVREGECLDHYINLRLTPPLADFVKARGGSPYVRFLVEDYMAYMRAKGVSG